MGNLTLSGQSLRRAAIDRELGSGGIWRLECGESDRPGRLLPGDRTASSDCARVAARRSRPLRPLWHYFPQNRRLYGTRLTALTRMPWGKSSLARHRATESSVALLAGYALFRGRPFTFAVEVAK